VGSYTAHGGHLFITFTATGYCASIAPTAITFTFGNTVYGQSFVYQNVANSHTTYPAWAMDIGIVAAGAFVWHLGSSGVSTDVNDHFSVTFMEVPV
jgi:hypothetical protein